MYFDISTKVPKNSPLVPLRLKTFNKSVNEEGVNEVFSPIASRTLKFEKRCRGGEFNIAESNRASPYF